MFIIAGLGNPEKKYEKSRHNTGRIALELFRKIEKINDWREDEKIKALKTGGSIDGKKLLLILPNTYMNNSGSCLKKIIHSKKQIEKLLVIHDDVDLPLGKFKFSWGRGSAGHKGVESIIKALKTKNFLRLRIGISPTTPKGKIKKPKKDKMVDFLMARFKPKELTIIKKLIKQKIIPQLERIIREGSLK